MPPKFESTTISKDEFASIICAPIVTVNISQFNTALKIDISIFNGVYFVWVNVKGRTSFRPIYIVV